MWPCPPKGGVGRGQPKSFRCGDTDARGRGVQGPDREGLLRPPGTDNRSATSLNGEYIVLKNTDTVTRSLTGWTTSDVAKKVYTFPKFSLGVGKSVTLYTGKGTNSLTKRCWGQSNYIWNNTGGRGLPEEFGRGLADSCKWTGGGSSVAC